MRAQEILEKLEAGGASKPFDQYFPSQCAVRGIGELRDRLEKLQGVPGFSNFETKLRESIVFKTASTSIDIPPPEWHELAGRVSVYAERLRGLHSFITAQVLTQQDKEAISVKLPSSSDLRSVIKAQERLATALEQVLLLKEVGGEVKLKSWEPGSLWLQIAVGGSAVVSLVGGLAWASAVVYKKIQEGRMHSQYVKSLELKNDFLESLVEAERRMLALLVEGEAKNIAAEHIKGEVSPDTLERVKFSIREFSAMIEEGAEIHPALQAPESVKNLFPNFKNLMGIESRTKLIEDEKKDTSI